MKLLLFCFMLLNIMFLTGCSSSHLLHSWKANTPVKNYNKILVLGLNTDKDPVEREKMEVHLAGDLEALKYHAVPAIKEYGPLSFSDLNEEQLLKKFANSGFDAVLTIVLLDKAKEQQYVRGNVNYQPNDTYRRYLWGYYNTLQDRIFSPGYYITNTRYFWESNFYDLTTRELVYSAQTESFDPTSAESLGHEYGQMIVKDMVKKNLLFELEIVKKR